LPSSFFVLQSSFLPFSRARIWALARPISDISAATTVETAPPHRDCDDRRRLTRKWRSGGSAVSGFDFASESTRDGFFRGDGSSGERRALALLM
jgi:hypothetical protein